MDLPEPADRLNSWKEIAAFLGRTVRTVQRWEKTQGLPLRRGGPGQRGAVVASKREIGEWWERRRSSLQDERAQDERPDALIADLSTPPPAGSTPLLWWAILCLGAASFVIAVLAGVRIRGGAEGSAIPPPLTGRLFADSTSEGRSVSFFTIEGSPSGLTLTSSGAVAYVSLYEHNAVAVIDLRERRVIDLFPVVERPGRLVLSMDGTRLVVAGRSELGVFDLRQRALTRFVPESGRISDVHLSADGREVWVALAQGGLKILDLETGRWEAVPTVGCPMFLASTPRSDRLFVSYQCGGPGGGWGHDAIEVIDMVSRTPIAARAGLPLVGGALAVAPDAEHVWVDTHDACANPEYDQAGCPPGSGPVLHAVRATSLEPLLTIRLPGPAFNSTPTFFPDGSRLVVVGNGFRVIDRTLGTILESMDENPESGMFTAGGRRFIAYDSREPRLMIFTTAAPPDSEALRGLASHWTGDGTANDVAGGAHPVRIDGVGFEPGRYGRAFAFDGVSGGVSFGRRLNVDIVTDKTASYAAWIKPRRLGVPLHIASRTTAFGWRWFVTAEGRLAFCRTRAAPDLACATGGLTGATMLPLDRWRHVAVIRRESELQLFVDGRVDGSMTMVPGFDPVGTSWMDADLRLGAGPAGSAPFDGLIDEVVLLRRSLSTAGVAEVMRATTFSDVTSITRR